jgi:hypothetical protein
MKIIKLIILGAIAFSIGMGIGRGLDYLLKKPVPSPKQTMTGEQLVVMIEQDGVLKATNYFVIQGIATLETIIWKNAAGTSEAGYYYDYPKGTVFFYHHKF